MPILDIFSTIITYIAQSETALLALQTVITGLAVKSLITAIASIFTGSAILGPKGLIIAAAATAGLMIAVNTAKSVGDISSPSSGKTQVSTKEGGLFELSKNDDLVAAPGLINKLNSPTQPLIVNQPTPTPPPQIDYDKMAQALSKIQVQTNIDGVKISSELQKAPMGMAIRKI
jgi:hypothetical protein